MSEKVYSPAKRLRALVPGSSGAACNPRKFTYYYYYQLGVFVLLSGPELQFPLKHDVGETLVQSNRLKMRWSLILPLLLGWLSDSISEM